ncbi:S-layer homology domain-containing protein [Paenibacillus sp. FA6]|uniref:S-layer homology domain-containing protein n=1 Tax=Paenibacillus sp. FA6 TaxID=3413029 RepID=UPI003F65DCA5
MSRFRDGKTLALKAFITRAEIAVIVQKLQMKSDLIATTFNRARSLELNERGVVNLMNIYKLKKIVACLLVFLLLVTSSGISAFADSNGGRGGIEQSVMNDELMRFLENEYGVENATSMFQTINDLGLVDSNGQFMNQRIYIDGTGYTLDEIKLILADENTDLTKIAEIDGEQISLDTLKKIIDIEDQLEALKQMYATPDDVSITPEHLDQLDSLITQAGNEGLGFYDEEGNPLGGNDHYEPNIEAADVALMATAVDETYEDGTYFRVGGVLGKTEIEGKTYAVLELTFGDSSIHRGKRTAPISFDYEQIEGALKSTIQDIGGTRYAPAKGTITIEPGEYNKTVKWLFDAEQYYANPQLPVDYKQHVWEGFARMDYLHFYNYKNLDGIRTDFYSLRGSSSSNSFFSHSYDGGAYISYGPGIRKGQEVRNPEMNGFSPDYWDFFRYAEGQRYGYPKKQWNPDKLEIDRVETAQGIYTTDQMVPITVTYNDIVTLKMLDSTPANHPLLQLKGKDLVATPVVTIPVYSKNGAQQPNGSYTGWGKAVSSGLSYIWGYQTIIGKDTVPDDLSVLQSSGHGDPYYYYMNIPRLNFSLYQPSVEAQWGYADRVLPDMAWGKPFSNTPAIVIMPARSDAFQSLVLDKSSYAVGDTAMVTVNLDHEKGRSDWLKDGGWEPEDIRKRLIVSFGNKTQGIVELHTKLGGDGLPIEPLVLEGTYEITEDIYDLMSNRNQVEGKLRAKIYYNRNPLSSGEDLEGFGLLSDMFTNFTVDQIKYIHPDDLTITYPTAWPSGESHVVSITNPVATQLGFTYPPDATFRTSDQFEWTSSDETVATINADGTIVPKQSGIVKFTLIAKNNGKLTPQTEITSEEIVINADGPAMVVVPDFANRVYVPKNKDANIVWTTNVMSKYIELAPAGDDPADANFEIELYEGFWEKTELAALTPIQTWKAPATTELINATHFAIPRQYMKDISNESTPSYTVRISTGNPEHPTRTLSALSYVVVNSEAAVIKLDKSMGQFVTDGIGSLDLQWDLANFDPVNKGDFDFKVTKNGTLISDSLITFDQATEEFSSSRATETGGSYKLAIDPVADSKSIKDVYAITLAAKNSLDSTWSYDSLYLQVYKSDALHIQIDGQSRETHTMSNVATIRNMTNDQRVALKRDISLKNEMSINNKDYTDIRELTDQIKWKSSNLEAGIINFMSGGIIADVEKFAYSSYQPKHSFTLSGMGDGETTITAIHAKTGIEAKLDVSVETLKDKLYLFQFYPKTSTTIVYTDKKGEERSISSNAKGELALFDENGIASDVFVTSKFNNTTYTGVLSQKTLLSKEKDPATLELYPINILQLRQLSKVEIFFKTPDGTPYMGEVTYRGGVYKNGHYAEATEIGGQGVTQRLGPKGKLEVIFDTTDFYSKEAGENNAATLSAKDQIEIVFEFMFERDEYSPQMLILDGNSNAVDMIAFGEKISTLIAHKASEKSPVMVNQYVVSDKDHYRIPILTYDGSFGPSNQVPSVKLTTEFMWWGEKVGDEAFAELLNEVGSAPQGQSYQTVKYPFSDAIITRHEQVLNQDTIWLEQAKSGSINFRLYDQPDSFRKSYTSAATVVNMIGVKAINSGDLSKMVRDLKEDMEKANGSTENPVDIDEMVKESLSLMDKLRLDVGPLSMRVIPTVDPMVYRTIISASLGNMPTIDDDNTSGGSGKVEFLQTRDSSFVPGLGDGKSVAKGTYLAEQKKEYKNSQKSNSDGSVLFSAGGYYVGEIRYNVESRQWETVVLGGGFHAGGGFEFTQNWNVMASYVPLTFSLTVGGGVEVDFKASVLFDQLPGSDWKDPELTSVNDYLTSLRIIAYVELFGGIGFDYSIIAAKIGVFGRVTIENTSTWLNREYLASVNDTMYGNKLKLEGIAGIKVVLKFLFISIEHDFATLRYSRSWVYDNWSEIQSYWSRYGVSPLTAANVDTAIAAYMHSIGEEDMHVLESKTMEDRNYLSEYDRAWHVSSSLKARSLDPVNEAPAALQTNAYPYANPQVAQDGSMFVYLSDGNSTAIEDTVASWAVKSGNTYLDKGPITTDKGYGDTGLQVAGEGNLIAAVWVRQQEKIDKAAGEEVTNEDIVLMNNSAEIMASIYNGTEWTTHRLTDNKSPDLAPVVAVNDGKVFVAYRSVSSSSVDNPLDFSESDNIVYTGYDTAMGLWSDVETLYNGTNGTVMGLAAEMLGDGTAAVMYSVNQGNVNGMSAVDNVAGTDNEIIYAVVNTELDGAPTSKGWQTKGIVKNLQVTSGRNADDRNANENPQLTRASFADNVERFVLAWHTTGKDTGVLEQDIKLLAINPDGEVYPDFIESLNVLGTYNDIKINPNFTFVKMKNDFNQIDHLSIMWKEAETDISPTAITTRDVLKAVKFGTDGQELYLSGVIDVAEMPDFTEIDTVDAYVNNPDGTEIKALILGTTYTTDTQVVGSITPKNGNGAGDDIPIHVSKTVSAMYTATETYRNKFNADEIILTPTDIVSGYDMPIQFSLVNQGLSRIDSVTIDVDGQTTSHSGLDLFPNSIKVLTAPYAVPAAITDIAYSVNVVFADGETISKGGKLKLDIPDVGISPVRIVEEEGGKRILSVPLYNKNDTTLAGKGRVVKLGLYRDMVYTDDNLINPVVTIASDDELNLIDNGAYVHHIELDMQDYLKTLGLTEIPDKGLSIYLHSWVEEANGDVVTEFDESNNDTRFVFENLAVKHNNTNILLTLEQTNTAANTAVELTMQNMNMVPVASGNVLLNLLDSSGAIVESRYLATNGSQLLAFSAEERKTETVQFSQTGNSVQTMFFQESADVLDSTLSNVTLSGVKVDFDGNITVYNLQSNDLKRTQLLATAANSKATVSLVDRAGKVILSNKGFVSVDQSLLKSPNGALNEFAIQVEPESESGTATDYKFAITNSETSQPSLELRVKGTPNQDGTYSGAVEVALSPYDVSGFAISKALYKVNDGNWTEAAFDGKAEQALTTLSDMGDYTVAAKVLLASGLEHNLDTVTLEIGKSLVIIPEPLELVAKGMKNQDGTYQGDVDLWLSPYATPGLTISKVQYEVNGSGWQEATFDGTREIKLDTRSDSGKYTIKVKLEFTTGEKVEGELKFEIAKQTDPEEPDPGEPDPGNPDPVKPDPGNPGPGNTDEGVDGNNNDQVTPPTKDVPTGVIRLRDGKGNLLVDLLASQMDGKKKTTPVNMNNQEEVNLQTTVQTLKDLYAKNKDGELLITFKSGTYTLPFDIVTRMNGMEGKLAGKDLNRIIVTLAINKLTGQSKQEVEQAFKAKFPLGKMVSDLSSIKLTISERGNAVVKDIAGIDLNNYANLTLHTGQKGNAVLQYANKGFSFVPAKFTNEVATAQTQSQGIFVVVNNNVTFSDISGHWGEQYINQSANHSLVDGMGNGKFAPNINVTRAQFVQMIVNSLNLHGDSDSIGKPYNDIATETWYYEAINQAKQAGLLTKFANGQFEPTKPITREEMTLILAVALRKNDVVVKKSERKMEDVFKDTNLMSKMFVSDIEMLFNANIMDGMGNGKFDPQGVVTRAQAASVMIKMLQVSNFID